MRVKKYDNIGEINFVKHSRATKMKIIVRPTKSIRVTLPNNSTYKDAENFVSANMDWLEKTVLKMKKIKSNRHVYDEKDIIETKFYKIKFSRHLSTKVRITENKYFIEIFTPLEADFKSDFHQNEIKNIMSQVYRREAKKYIPVRLDFLAKEHHFKYLNVKITSAKTRWGSCSYKDNINISLFIMKLPNYLIDYILLHELCHTIEKNHGVGFWNLMEKVSPNSKELRQELRNYRIS